MKILLLSFYFLITTSVIYFTGKVFSNTEANSHTLVQEIQKPGNVKKIILPEDFSRIQIDDNTFGSYLRNLEIKPSRKTG